MTVAATAFDDAREEALIAVVPLAAFQILVALLEDLVRLLEEHLRHERVVVPSVEHLAPADLAHVDRVLEHVEHNAAAPLAAIAVAVASLVELLRDGRGAFPAEGVHLEHLADDHRFFLVDDETLLRVEPVAVGHIAAHEAPALSLLLHADLGALDDGGMLKLGKDAEHLEHHFAPGVRGIERLGDALEGDAVLGELVHHLGELADLAGEPVNAEDQQRVEGLVPGIVKHLFEAGAVHVGAALGVPVHLVKLPGVAPLGLREGLEALLLGAERILLVVLVRRDAGVEGNPRCVHLRGGPGGQRPSVLA
jgi:hypothetical protein